MSEFRIIQSDFEDFRMVDFEILKTLLGAEGTVSFHGSEVPKEGFFVSIPSMSWCSSGDPLTLEAAGAYWFSVHKDALESTSPTPWSSPAVPDGSSLLYAGHWRQEDSGVTRDWLDVNIFLPNKLPSNTVKSMMVEFAGFLKVQEGQGWAPSRWNSSPPGWRKSDLARFVGRCWAQEYIWDIKKGIKDKKKGALSTSFNGE